MHSKKPVVATTLSLIILVLAATFQTANASDGTWQMIPSSIPQPSARYNSATNSAVYASSINSMVFFGGYDLITFQSDAWKLDLTTLQWWPLPSSTPGPPGRLSQAAVYDAAHNRMVLYGGFAAGYVEFQDLWAYEFDSSRWVELPQTSFKPGDRGWASAIYNPLDTTIVLFGGQDLDGNFFNDIWILDLNQLIWQQIPPASGWPDTRINASLVLDEQTNRAWMFGGFHRPGDFNFQELWSLDLSTFQWTQHPLGSPAPSARDAAPAFFEPVSRSMVIFGGSDVNNNRALNDLWAYSVDSHTWRQLNASGVIPTPRRASPSVFVPSQNRLFLFGGIGLPNLTVFGDGYMLNLVPLQFCSNAKGDLNGDADLTAADVVLILNCVFLGNGNCDPCFADVSCNGTLNTVDVVILLNAVFLEDPIDCSP